MPQLPQNNDSQPESREQWSLQLSKSHFFIHCNSHHQLTQNPRTAGRRKGDRQRKGGSSLTRKNSRLSSRSSSAERMACRLLASATASAPSSPTPPPLTNTHPFLPPPQAAGADGAGAGGGGRRRRAREEARMASLRRSWKSQIRSSAAPASAASHRIAAGRSVAFAPA
jgi:hypothetical protein